MKNVLLIHGFNGIPKIFYYFKNELKKLGYNVILPSFPTREDITIQKYFNILDKYKEYFDENLIVVAHSIGNPILIKYISKNSLKIGKYISLAGFSKSFFIQGKDVLNEKVKLITLTDKEKNDATELIKERYSIYSKSDHLVPYYLLEGYCYDIKSVSIPINDIGHMGKKSNLEKLPEVIELITKKQEIIDIYDINKNKTGKTKIRYSANLEDGEFIIGVQAVIINSKKQILISKRSDKKKKLPLKWECNGGALICGENAIDGLIREIHEELGINLLRDDAIFLKSIQSDNAFKEIYLFKKDILMKDIKFNDGETVDAKWVNIDEFIRMFNNKEVVYNIDFNANDYEQSLMLLGLK